MGGGGGSTNFYVLLTGVRGRGKKQKHFRNSPIIRLQILTILGGFSWLWKFPNISLLDHPPSSSKLCKIIIVHYTATHLITTIVLVLGTK